MAQPIAILLLVTAAFVGLMKVSISLCLGKVSTYRSGPPKPGDMPGCRDLPSSRHAAPVGQAFLHPLGR